MYGHGNQRQTAAVYAATVRRTDLIVKQNAKTFYADPDTIHNQVYTGYRVQYQAYKQVQLLASRQNPALNVHPDPHGVVVNELDGWILGQVGDIC